MLSAMSPVPGDSTHDVSGPGSPYIILPPSDDGYLDTSFIPYNPDYEGVNEPQQGPGMWLTAIAPGDARSAAYNDIEQGTLDTCVFASVLSAVARTDFNLASRISAAPGGYNVQLFGSGSQPVTIFVSSSQPITTNDLQPADNGEIWTTIYQRAYLTLQQQLGRNYKLASNAFEAVTGKTSTSLSLAGAGINQAKQIKAAMSSGSPVVAVTIPGTPNDNKYVIPGSNGLVESHAYTVLGVLVPANGALSGVKVTLRNPWGKDTSNEYFDADGDGKLSLSEYLTRQYGINGIDDGIIQVSWNQFVQFFSSVRISSLTGPSINDPMAGDLSPPTFTTPTPSSISVRQGETVGYIDFDAIDSRGRVPFFALRDDSPGYINPTSGEYWWTPTNQYLGTYVITVEAESTPYEKSILTFQITVTSGLPNVTSLTANRTSINDAGTDLLTLTANNVTTAVGSIDSVSFYRDSNGNGELDRSTDAFLGYGTQSGSNWAWSGYVGGVSTGTARFFAQARRFSFNDTFYSPARSTTLTVTAAPIIAPVATPITNPIQATPTQTYDQYGTTSLMDGAGNVRTFWTSNTGAAFTRQFNRAGTALTGAQALTAIPAVSSFPRPHYAMLADGSFVAVWAQSGTLYGRWFTAAAATNGSQFTIATGVTFGDNYLAVATDAAGNLLIAYHTGEYSSEDVYAVSVNRNGTIARAPWRVNSTADGTQKYPTVALNSAGDGVIAWTHVRDYFGLPRESGIVARRVSQFGKTNSAEFNAGSGDSWDSRMSSAVNSSGSFVLSWDRYDYVQQRSSVYARYFGRDGAPLGNEFQVNTFNGGDLSKIPRVVLNDLGWSAFGWSSYGQDSSPNTNTYGVYAQIFDPQRNPIGPEFRVPTNTAYDQYITGLMMTADADVCFAWNHGGIFGTGTDLDLVYLRGYRINLSPAFSAANLSFSVPENSAIGTTVGTALATDPDPVR